MARGGRSHSGSRPSADRDGTAWVHRCHLTREGLAFEPWEERFLSDEISPLYFRDPTPHRLHAGANDEAETIARIAGDYHLEPLEFQGDWMRVRLKTPSDYCVGPAEVRTKEGWIRWRSAERGTGRGTWYEESWLNSLDYFHAASREALLFQQIERGQLPGAVDGLDAEIGPVAVASLMKVAPMTYRAGDAPDRARRESPT